MRDLNAKILKDLICVCVNEDLQSWLMVHVCVSDFNNTYAAPIVVV